MIRAPPKKVVLPPKVEKVVKPPSAKSKVTTSVSNTAASKQPPLKSASGSSKAKARAEPAKVTAVKKAAVKSGLPVNSKTSTGGGGGPALVARMLGKGPAQLSKKVPATSSGSSKTSTPGASRRRVHFPGQVCYLTSAHNSFRLRCSVYTKRIFDTPCFAVACKIRIFVVYMGSKRRKFEMALCVCNSTPFQTLLSQLRHKKGRLTHNIYDPFLSFFLLFPSHAPFKHI